MSTGPTTNLLGRTRPLTIRRISPCTPMSRVVARLARRSGPCSARRSRGRQRAHLEVRERAPGGDNAAMCGPRPATAPRSRLRPGCSRSRRPRLRPGRDLDPAAFALLTRRARPGQAAEADREPRQRGDVLGRANRAIHEPGRSIEMEEAQPAQRRVDRIGDPDREPGPCLVPAGIEVGDRAAATIWAGKSSKIAGEADANGSSDADANGSGDADSATDGSGLKVGETSGASEASGELNGSSVSSGPWNGWTTRLPVAGVVVSPSAPTETVPCQATTARPVGSTVGCHSPSIRATAALVHGSTRNAWGITSGTGAAVADGRAPATGPATGWDRWRCDLGGCRRFDGRRDHRAFASGDRPPARPAARRRSGCRGPRRRSTRQRRWHDRS